MRAAKPGVREYQVAAEIHHEYERHGLTWAYGSIVGGGANACILHYVENSDVLKDGDLLLIDAGGEWQGYCADITRSFPVNGRYSGPQKAVYEVVLAAQLAAIEESRVGKHWNQPHEAAVRVLTEGLVSLGLLKGEVKELVEKEAYKRFYMHSTGHWLGMDVHDVGAYKLNNAWRVFEPDMVLTVEPGLYITPAENVDQQFWNIGIRIEDDVLVTAKGPRVLTHEAPKQIVDIEALMRT
ncbi:MAG: M24B family metallopeptidase [Nevskiales bacterium]